MTDTQSGARPVLVLGLGNLLLCDDAVGLRMLERLQRSEWSDTVDFVDGGTQGIALTGQFSGRRSVLVLDAVGLGMAPGTVHVLKCDEIARMRARRGATSHEGNGLGLIEMARLLGDLPDEVVVVGVEPAKVKTGIGLSPEIETGMERALVRAREILDAFCAPESAPPTPLVPGGRARVANFGEEQQPKRHHDPHPEQSPAPAGSSGEVR